MSILQIVTNNPVVGLDIGGTKLAAGLVSPTGQLLFEVRRPTPQTNAAEEIFAAVADLARQVLAFAETKQLVPERIGVGCGGPMLFPQGIVSPLHIPAWQNFPLKERLATEFNRPVVVDNDAKAFALGEAIWGAGQGARSLLGMIISTGVGAGLVINGQLQHGASGNAGHIGHMIVVSPSQWPKRAPLCHCGARGCLTAYAAGQALVERARLRLSKNRYKHSMLATIPADELSGEFIAKTANAGDKLATRLISEAAEAIASTIAGVAALLDLDRVVLGGGLVQSGPVLLQPMQEALTRNLQLSFTRNLEVRLAELGIGQAGIIGAAALAYANS